MVPHLAFIEPERYDRVIRLLKKRNAKYKRSESEKNDPRAGIPKRHTRFPGQLCRCGVCGRLFVFGGHGKKDRLMCNGSRDYACWNAITISGPDVANAVTAQIHQFIIEMEEFDAEWVAEYERQRESLASAKNGELAALQKELLSTERKLANQSDALEKIGASDSIVARIRELDNIVLNLKHEISVCFPSMSWYCNACMISTDETNLCKLFITSNTVPSGVASELTERMAASGSVASVTV